VDPRTADEDALRDVDAWNIRAEGDWLRFTARLAGRQGVRGFRRHVSGGAILGDAPGPVMAILGLGGPSAALATPGPPSYPHHVVAPADDIGAVGMAGIEAAPETDRLEGLRECTHEALVAETLLDWRLEAFAPLPLFRCPGRDRGRVDRRRARDGSRGRKPPHRGAQPRRRRHVHGTQGADRGRLPRLRAGGPVAGRPGLSRRDACR
jgi:hypothetical protein